MTSTFFPRFKFPSVRLAGLVLPALPSSPAPSSDAAPTSGSRGRCRSASGVVGGAMTLAARRLVAALGEKGVASAWRGRERAAR